MAIVVVGSLIVVAQLINFTHVWGGKHDWQGATSAMIAERDTLDPAITHIADDSVMGYYNRQFGVRNGVSLNLAWRNHTYDEMQNYAELVSESQSVWVVMPTNVPKTWYAAGFLDEEYSPIYRDSVLNYVFYRFDRVEDEQTTDLHFRFGDTVSYSGEITSQYTLSAGEQFCPEPVEFTALRDFDNRYSMGLHLVFEHNPAVAQWDGGLGAHEEGDTIRVEECIDLPETLAAGHYHLRLIVYEWETVTNQQVLENSGDDPMLWGHQLFIAEVIIQNEDGE